jgi:FkbM family methyltransferase
MGSSRCTVSLLIVCFCILECVAKRPEKKHEDSNTLMVDLVKTHHANPFHEDTSTEQTTDARGQQNPDGMSPSSMVSLSERDRQSVMLRTSDLSQSRSNLITWQQAFKEDPALFTGCTNIFLDVGSNRGTHIRKLFEPQKYPKCEYVKFFDEGFGAAEKRTRPFKDTGLCAFGFEANPQWASRLQEIEKAYTAQGWRVKWFAPTGVSDTKGSLDFWNNDQGTNSDWGFSMTKSNEKATKVEVPTIDFPAFIEDLHKNAPSGYRLMKMDIESAEFQVLPKFVTKQLLCKNVLDRITIEWHEQVLKTEESKKQATELKSQVMSQNTCKEGPSTEVLDIDDESYLEDGMPLPGGSVLSSMLELPRGWHALAWRISGGVILFTLLASVALLCCCVKVRSALLGKCG